MFDGSFGGGGGPIPMKLCVKESSLDCVDSEINIMLPHKSSSHAACSMSFWVNSFETLKENIRETKRIFRSNEI